MLGNSQKEYYRAVLDYSIKNQLVYKGNLGMFKTWRYVDST